MGVSTIPGATALKRMPCFAYSMARLRVIASSPPLVIMTNEALTPAIGCSTMAVVTQVTLPPLFCSSICLTASCVMLM